MQLTRLISVLFIGCLVAILLKDSYAQKSIIFENPSDEEMILHNLINEYRLANNRPAIQLSKSLSHVAKAHVKDLMEHPPTGRCNMHSWSSDGPWTPCCYTPDHAKASCMWNKPRELTNYKGKGFENCHWSSDNASPNSALNSWKSSPGHNAIILNQGIWTDYNWKNIGVGIHKSFAVIWFGTEIDPDGYWDRTPLDKRDLDDGGE